MKKFKVGVFREKKPDGSYYRYHAYTRTYKYHACTLPYNQTHQGCIEIEIEAKNGTEAKKKAIALVRLADGFNEKEPWKGSNL